MISRATGVVQIEEDLVGHAPASQNVLNQIRIVAQSGSTTLIQGETGTGKEVVARAIHNQSSRADGPFVKVNCAAIPTALLESLFFGHERGAFTGATTQTRGRFQLADHGTLFLDEIGDLPLELQPKLLRALQEQEFEPLGSSRTIRVDVRVVAATNQDLARLVSLKQFRPDLYYRLNVIPIYLPPLRERSDDIPELVRHFVQKFSRRLNKQMATISPETRDLLKRYDWPGNIRELQNVIERAMVLSPGPVLRPVLTECRPGSRQESSDTLRTLAAAERDHIIEVLNQTKWMIGGQDGAAIRLGLPRTTLIHRMRKLGIETRRSRRPSVPVDASSPMGELPAAAGAR